MFSKLTSSIVGLLNAGGINAGRAYPRAAMVKQEGCFVRARLESVKKSEPGFAAYLGTETDAEGSRREVYGMKCEIELALDIYAFYENENAAVSCEAMVDDIIFALGGSEGLSINSVTCAAAKPDRDTECFLCPCRASLSVLLTARAEDENVQFSDFILKGEIKK